MGNARIASFCIPILILLLSINLLTLDKDFYKLQVQNYEDHKEHLENILHFFKGDSLNIEWFTEKERAHMQDVRNLLWTSWIIIGILTIALMFSLKSQNSEEKKKTLIQGAIYSLILTIVLSLTLISFSESFIAFHKILFTNDLWLLPANSLLIQMFPQEFFIQSTKQIILYSIILSLLFITLGIKIPGETNNDKRT